MKDARYGLTLMRAARYMTRVYNRHLARVSLTISQHGILDAIERIGPVAHQDLADNLVIERSALQRTLQPLIRAGFVESSRDPENKKRMLYTLAGKGRQRLDAALSCVSAAELELKALFEELDISDSLCIEFPFDTIAASRDETIAAN